MLTRREKLWKLCKQTANWLSPRNSSSAALFIFGEMRSGTNMLTDCLDKSWQTAVFNETDDEAFDGYVLRADAVLKALMERARASHVIFKALADSARAGELLSTFPESRGVWIFRRYQDVVNSALRKWSEHNKYLYYILHEPKEAGWRRLNLSDVQMKVIDHHYSKGLSEASARALIWYIRNDHFFEQNLDTNEKIKLLAYEDLVTAPVKHLSEIFDFIGLEFSSSFVQEVSTTSIGKSEPPKIDSEINGLCEDLTKRLSDQWRIQNTILGNTS